MVFFDMDGVLVDVSNYEEIGEKVAVSTWHVVFDALGIIDEHQRLKAKFKAGEFPSYMEWTDEACRVLQRQDLTKETFLNIIRSQSFIAGATETIRTLKERGYQTAVITGSFNVLAERVQSEMGIDDVVAHCNLEFDDEGKLNGWKLTPCDYEGKVGAFLGLARKHGADPAECVYIGDEVNDIPIFQKAGLAIAFNCNKEVVKKAAHVVVDSKDLRGVLEYIGM